MGKFDIGINLLRRTFSSASRREINLANNKELKKFIFNNGKNGNYTSIELKTLKSCENPYKEKFYGVIPESSRDDAIQRAKSGDLLYYITKNGDLYYKSPKNSSSKTFKVILGKSLKLINKANHNAFKRKISNGKYNSNPIIFEPAKTVEDAIKFAKNNGLAKRFMGVNKDNQSDLELLNTINKALCNVHNKTGGRSIMPGLISIKNNMKTADGYDAVAAYTNILDILRVNRNQKLSLFTIYHEMGHANHALNTDLTKMARIEEIIALGGTNAKVTSRFCNDPELQGLIQKYMRSYASSSPAEFVADAFANMVEGNHLHYKLHQAYDALKGAQIISRA